MKQRGTSTSNKNMVSTYAPLFPVLTDFFERINFTNDAIEDLLAPQGYAAIFRGEPAAVNYYADSSELGRAIRFFILRDPMEWIEAEEFFGAPLRDALMSTHVAHKEHTNIVINADIRPHILNGKQHWVFSDMDSSMSEENQESEHVLGVGAASLSLLHAIPTSPVLSLLDLGTGSGVQLLAQAQSAHMLVGTDISQRALNYAHASLQAADALSTPGLLSRTQLLQGSWFEPVQGRKFERIIANPPFVVGTGSIEHVYRDSGLDLDGATALVVSQTPEYLLPGGRAHLLGSWIHSSEQSWHSRVASWIPATGIRAWILERDNVDPALYIGTWLRDEGIDPRSARGREMTQQWLEHFAKNNVTAIGFGFIHLERIGDDEPSDVLAESLNQVFEDDLGPEVEEYFIRANWLSQSTKESLLESQYLIRPQLAVEKIYLPNTEDHCGFHCAKIRITRMDGPRFSHEIDEHIYALLSGLNPHGLSLEDIICLYAASNGWDEEELYEPVIRVIVDLIRHGLILPVDLIKS